MHIFRTPLRGFLKKLLLFSVFFLLGNVVLFGNFSGTSQVVAQQPFQTLTNLTDDNLREKVIEMDGIGATLINLANLILRPLLAICGWAMDNSMVYGSVFGFDSALWTLRNLTKNLANFFLAFLFIYTILKSLFSGNNKIGSEFKTLITNTLIAGILIQASWFLTSAAVDLSTIATYGVGGLPITILGSSSDENLDLVYFNHERVINFEQQGDSFIQDLLILHTKDWNISPCATTKIEWMTGGNSYSDKVILGRKVIAYQSRLAGNQRTGTQPGLCHDFGYIYRFQEGFLEEFLNPLPTIDEKGQDDRNTAIKDASRAIDETGKSEIGYNNLTKLFQEGKILFLPGETGEGLRSLTPQKGYGRDQGNERLKGENQTFPLQDVISNSQSYVGVMTTMFASLLTLQKVSLEGLPSSETNSFVSCLNTLLNVFYILALLVPVLALAVVLVVRIIILWVLIAISPIWIVLVVFNKEGVLGKFKDYFSKQEVVGILFAPVLITFAVSLSTVFIFLVMSTNLAAIDAAESMNFLGLRTISIQGVGIKVSKIIFSLIGIAIVWALLFRAIKATKIGKEIGGYIEEFTTGVLENTRFIPFPGLNGGASINMITGNNGMIKRITRNIPESMRKDNLLNLKGSGLENLFKDEIARTERDIRDDAIKNYFKATDFINKDYENIKNRKYTIEYDEGGIRNRPVTFTLKDLPDFSSNQEVQSAMSQILSSDKVTWDKDILDIFDTYLENRAKDATTDKEKKQIKEEKELLQEIKNNQKSN